MKPRVRGSSGLPASGTLIIFIGLVLLMWVSLTSWEDLTCSPADNALRVPPHQHKSDCAYLFMLSSNAFFPCFAVAVHSLQETGTESDIVVMITGNVWDSVEEAVRSMGVITMRIDAVANPNRSVKRNHLRDNFTKLRAWQLIDYKKVIYSDSDFVYTRNSDDLCHLPAPVNAGRNFVSTQGDWTDENFFNAGFMVITPSAETFCYMTGNSTTFFSPTGGDQPFQNAYWKDQWAEIDYKYDGANANIFFTRPEEWDPKRVRSIHYTRATNPCNHHFEDDIREEWDNFERNGMPDESVYHPLALWLQAKDSLLEDYPEFQELFDRCGFMRGWDDGGKAFQKDFHPLGFL